MIRRAGPQDVDALRVFLQSHVQDAMFPLGNLSAHGVIPQGQTDAPDKAMRVWIYDQDNRPDSRIVAVFALTQTGMMMPVFSKAFTQAGSVDWRALIAGLSVIGCLGQSFAARSVLSQLGVEEAATKVDEDEPHYALDLADLQEPIAHGAELIPLDGPYRDLAVTWRRAYLVEVLGAAEDSGLEQAEKDIASYRRKDSHRLLLKDGRPVAMTGFNAQVDDTVQIGGVYTPPELRGRGHARLAVALHLAQARNAGVKQVVLFAASEGAAKAYEAIGFSRIGSFTLCMFQDPVEIEG